MNYSWDCNFACFDVCIEKLEAEDKDLFDRIKQMENELKKLSDCISTEIDRMWDDYKYDHDNYDSIQRERNLKNMKERAVYLKNRVNEILKEEGYSEIAYLF